MKKFKFVLWALLIGFLGLLVYQNQGVFLAKHNLDIHLGFAQYHIPELYSIVIILVFFFCGMLIAYAASLFERYRSRKQIRSLKQSVDSYEGTIATLKQEVDGLKPQVPRVTGQEPVALESAAPSDAKAGTE